MSGAFGSFSFPVALFSYVFEIAYHDSLYVLFFAGFHDVFGYAVELVFFICLRGYSATNRHPIRMHS
jgi:hypothetical protein